MGKEKEISDAEECTHGRREGRGTPAVGGGGRAILMNTPLHRNEYFYLIILK